MSDGGGEVSRLEEVAAQRRVAEQRVVTAEVAAERTESLLRARQSILSSILDMYRENNFGMKYRRVVQSVHGGEKRA